MLFYHSTDLTQWRVTVCEVGTIDLVSTYFDGRDEVSNRACFEVILWALVISHVTRVSIHQFLRGKPRVTPENGSAAAVLYLFCKFVDYQ